MDCNSVCGILHLSIHPCLLEVETVTFWISQCLWETTLKHLEASGAYEEASQNGTDITPFSLPGGSPSSSWWAQVFGPSWIRHWDIIFAFHHQLEPPHLSLELNKDHSWSPNSRYQAYVVKRSSGPRAPVNSCISINASLLDSVLPDRVSDMIFITILYDAFYTYTDITVFYHRGVIEETSASQVLKRKGNNLFQ